jgi:superfamily I DNA/RNA helicase
MPLTDTDLLADLTTAQSEAVTTIEGPLLVLAGAGSGKTRVITRRVAYLLLHGIRASNILAITFTNKAAGEMKQRVEALLPGSRVWISTFHSLGARLLRQYADRLGLDRNYTIYDQTDRARVVKLALEDAGIDEGRFNAESISGAISKAKNQLLSPTRYAEKAHDYFTQTVAKVYPAYEARLKGSSALDFDDLLYWPALALKNDQELRAELDARFKYVLIDEYQDTNQAQYAIARGLSVDYPNLCVVGDPDQCLLPGTLVDTPTGSRPIETIQEGELVTSGIGGGKTAALPVEKVMVNPYRGKVLRITVEGGLTFRATPNHVCFAREDKVNLDVEWSESSRPDRSEDRGREIPFPSAGVLRSRTPAVAPRRAAPRFIKGTASVSFVDAETFHCIRADGLIRGMLVPVCVEGRIEERHVTAIAEEEYEGPVYDLSVPPSRNFIAGGVVVHNSIYKWRGSDIRNILDFERDFPTARVLTLSTNYRSTKKILQAASTLIAHNKQRKPKDLVTDNAAGEPVTLVTYETGHDEAEGIADTIARLVADKKRSYRDFAVFMRVNALSRALETAFVKARVPFQIVKGLAFFERKENRDVLAYLRLLLNPRDDISFLRIVNEPARGIGKVSLEHVTRYATDNELSLLEATAQVQKITLLKGKAANALRDFAILMRQLTELKDGPPDEVIRQVLDRTGYRAMLQSSTDEEDADRLANIEELITAAKEFTREDTGRTLGDFLENITLASDVDGWNEKQDCVSIMTMHAAKGLEFPVVFLTAMEQGLLPHERSLGKTEDIEEERRLCFVGLTRAKEQLFLSNARMREFRGSTLYTVPSMFLDELPPDAVREVDASSSGMSAADRYRGGGTPAARQGWNDAGIKPIPLPIPTRQKEGSDGYIVGMLVRHATYGEGQIIEVSGFGALRKVKIRFRTAGERSFIADKVTLEILQRPA